MRKALALMRAGALLFLTIGLLSPASAKLNSPSCKELQQWGQALYAARWEDKRPIAPLCRIRGRQTLTTSCLTNGPRSSFPPELKPIVSRGELTVRAMRAFGLLRRNEEELVVSLRARGLDLRGASYEDMQVWVSSGVAESIVLSVQDKEGVNGLLRQMESLRAAVAIDG